MKKCDQTSEIQKIMAGHSKFKNIMHRKGAQDKKRAKEFSRLGREISVAVKVGGEDPESNIRLRSAIASARGLNMPKDNIEIAIKKGQGNDPDSNYEEVRYEGYEKEKTILKLWSSSAFHVRKGEFFLTIIIKSFFFFSICRISSSYVSMHKN